MLKATPLKAAGLAVLAAAAFTIAAPAAGAEDRLVKIDGSSTVYPITEGVAEEFQKMKRGAVKVTVGVSGTGVGFKKFCRGETDISDASRPILKKEMDACKEAGIQYVELPVAYDALTVVVNLKNDWIKSMTVAELKKLWEPAAQGKTTRWNQINPAWPDAPVKLFGPGADSGTFDYFTEAVVVVAKEGRPAVLPSPDTVKNGTYQPLSRPIFIYVSAKAMARPEVKEFVEFYLANAAKISAEVKYVPLPEKAYKLALDNFSRKKLGTVFDGEAEVGVSVEALLRREGKH